MNRGISAVKSHPALTELAEMFVPSCAIMNAVAMNQIYSISQSSPIPLPDITQQKTTPLTPNLCPLDGPSSKNLPRSSIGDQIASP